MAGRRLGGAPGGAAALRRVHGRVRAAQQVGEAGVRPVAGAGQADGGAGRQGHPAGVEGRRQTGREVQHLRVRVRVGRQPHHGGELVAAQPGGEAAAFPAPRGEAPPDGGDDPVAGLVAVGVVDLLEAVEVQQQNGGVGMPDRPPGAGRELLATHQARQPVRPGGTEAAAQDDGVHGPAGGRGGDGQSLEYEVHRAPSCELWDGTWHG